MFKLNPDPTFTAPVKIPVHGGESQKVVFVFKHMDDQGLAGFHKWLSEHNKKKIKSIKESLEHEVAFLLKVVEGWEDVDSDFSKDNLIAMISNYKGAAGAIFETWKAEIAQSAEKN